MRKITIGRRETLNGGINWKDFADGFCDGVSLGLVVATVGGYAVTRLLAGAGAISTGCDALIPFDW